MAQTNKVAVGDDNGAASGDHYAWLTLAASQMVGRKASGDIAAMTVAEIRTLLSVYTQDEIDALLDGLDWQNSVLDYITDNTVAPPSENSGDRYILSHDGGAPHADWDGASAGDMVEFNGSTWDAVTPNEGYCSRVEDVDTDYVWNGSAWVTKASGTNHNSLASLQGGTSSEYYHLTSARHTVVALLGDLTPAANKVPMFSGAAAATLVELTASTIFGRKASGNAVALTPAEARTVLDLDANYAKLVGAVDIEITDAAKGIVLRDTQGTPHKWRVTVDNSGNLVTSDLGVA